MRRNEEIAGRAGSIPGCTVSGALQFLQLAYAASQNQQCCAAEDAETAID
jgi:hypothetical protein